MGKIIIIASAVLLFLLLVGFFLGFARDWCRSLVRFAIVLIDFAFSLLISPVIANALIGKWVTGTTLNLFSISIDFSEIAEGLLESNISEDLSIISSEIESVAKSLINVVLNVVMFFLLFFLILLLSLIIYFIVWIIVKNVTKKSDSASEAEPEKHISTRFLGGFVGMFTTFIISFALLIPLFGAMDICNKFIVNSETPVSQNVASAVSPQNLIAGQLYYTEDQNIGKFENLIEQYSYAKATYDKSGFGKFFNFTRIGKMGSGFFNYLTRVKYKEDTVRFSDEASAVIDTYNTYKEAFKKNKFDWTNDASLDGACQLFEKVTRSKVASNIIESILPKVLDNFSQGKKFLGIEIKTTEQLKDLVFDVFDTLKVINNASRLSYNVNIVVDTLKILNNHGVIESIKNGTVFEAISSDDSLIKDVVVKLVSSEEIKNRLPIIVDDMVEYVYKLVTGNEDYQNLPVDTQFEIENWQNEAQAIQKVALVLLNIKKDFGDAPVADGSTVDDGTNESVNESGEQVSEGANQTGEISGYDEIVAENSSANENAEEPATPAEIDFLKVLGNFGLLLDYSRESVILSNPIRQFTIGVINSKIISEELLSASSKTALVSYINDKWNSVDEFKFAELFSLASRIGKWAAQMSAGDNLVFEELKAFAEEIVQDENLKSNFVEFMDLGIIDDVIKGDKYKIVAYDMFCEIIYNTNAESIEADVEAVLGIVELVNSTTEFTAETAQKSLETIAQSDVIMDYIENNLDAIDGSDLKTIVDENLSDAEKSAFESAIENSQKLTESQKEIFSKLFESLGL